MQAPSIGLAGAVAALAGALLAGPGFGQTKGPGGESPTPSSAVTLTEAEAAKLKEGHYTAALLWHTSSDFVNAVTAGATDAFKQPERTVRGNVASVLRNIKTHPDMTLSSEIVNFIRLDNIENIPQAAGI